MPFEALFAHFGVTTYGGLVGALQPALAGSLATEASEILTAGDETTAQNFLDRVVAQTPAEELMQKLSGGSQRSPSGTMADAVAVTRHPLLHPPRPMHSPAQRFLHNALNFAELTLELEIQREKKDAEAAVTLLEAAGVLSLETARQLRTELCSKESGVVNEANTFVFRVAGIFLDPAVKNFPESLTRPLKEDDINIRRFADEKEWARADLFGRLTFLTTQDWDALRRGETKGILHPLIKIKRSKDLPPSAATSDALAEGASEPLLPNELPPHFRQPVRLLLPPSTMIIVPPDDLLYGGALMRLEGEIFRPEQSGVSYELRRRTIYRLLSEGRFAEAAQMIDGISDLPTLVKFFEDLVGGEAGEQNGYRNAEQFLNNTAIYAGKMFAELPAAKVAQIILLLYRHSRHQDQEALNQWLLLAFRAVRPKELLEEFSPKARLPHLSTILGTLIEWEKTRLLAEILLKEGLERHHPSFQLMNAAMRHLHTHDPSFAHPGDLEMIPDTPIFDKKRWAEKHRVVRKGRMIGPLVDRFAGPKVDVKRTPFQPPATSLAHRQEIYVRLRDGLGKFLEETESLEAFSAASLGGKKIAAISNLVLLTLPPADVHRLLIEATKEKPFPISELLAQLLFHQPADIVLDYFKAWGADAADFEMKPISQAWVALWNLGKRGEILVAEVVALALKEDTASGVVQKLMNPFQDASEDVDIMADKIEMYKTLLENPNLRGALNPYEIFEATGVLRPADLSGKFKAQAIERAMKILSDVDRYGKLNVGTKFEVTGFSALGDMIRMGARSVPDPESGQTLTADEQTLWRRRIADLLIQLKADEPAVVSYFASQLASADEATWREAYRILDRLGPRAQKILVAHIRRRATLKVARKLPNAPSAGALKHLDVPTHEIVELPVSLKSLFQKFPLTSRAMQTYIREQIFRADTPYKKEFKKHGHIDHIAIGEVETPTIIRELAELGDEALILLRHLVEEKAGIEIELYRFYGGAAARAANREERKGDETLFLPLLDLAERIGTPAAHQILVDIYKVVQEHTNVGIRGGLDYFAPTQVLWVPLRLIIRALARLEAKPGYTGPIAVEAHANFISRYARQNPVEVTLAVVALAKAAEGKIGARDDVAKKIAEAWEENESSAWDLVGMLRENGPLLDCVLGYFTSPPLYWELLRYVGESPPSFDAVLKIALNADPNNHQRGIAIKTVFWNFRGIRMNVALVPPPTPDPALKLLYDSGLAARYADPEDLKYFEAVSHVKNPL